MFLTSPCFLRQIRFGRVTDGPDKFWRVQQFLRLSWVRIANFFSFTFAHFKNLNFYLNLSLIILYMLFTLS